MSSPVAGMGTFGPAPGSASQMPRLASQMRISRVRSTLATASARASVLVDRSASHHSPREKIREKSGLDNAEGPG